MPRRIAPFVAALITLLSAAWPALADPNAQDREAIRNTISSQLEAFKRDDGAAAFAFAAEPLQKMFGTPETFLDMVRKGYAPVYRPKSVVFGAASGADGAPVQDVLITDDKGVDWIARYTLERQPDGSWRITGCRLIRNDGGSA